MKEQQFLKKMFVCEKVETFVLGLDDWDVNDLTVEKLAQEIGCNRSYISRKFRQQKGINISDYIGQVKLEKGISKSAHSSPMISERILDYLEKLPADELSNISLKLLSARLNLNKSYISRTFKQEQKNSFCHFMQKLKIEKCIELLENHKEMTVNDVCESMGFVNRHYFNTLFKKFTGYTPIHFKRTA